MTDPSTLNKMSVWHLGNPGTPVLVGEVSLIAGTVRCSFTYSEEWKGAGYPLSPDMPLAGASAGGIIIPDPERSVPGALEDAMPDRWGQGMIRTIDRPKRLTALDFLYYAGDRRSGALGISTTPDRYEPRPDEPILTAESLEEANEIIQRLVNREPLDEKERRMLGSGRSPGGAQPKLLTTIDGAEWITKFPSEKSNVDYPLIEYAAMQVAHQAKIETVEAKVLPVDINHVVLTKRFDRAPGRRLHTLSAKTLLYVEGGESYAGIANVIREFGDPERIEEQRRQLFRRMVFNILFDNTDDHTKNHSFVLNDDGYYELSPAYDIPPQMNGLGFQAIPIAEGEPRYSRSAAIKHADKFALSGAEADDTWQEVADAIQNWEEIFSESGVRDADIDYLSDFIDSDNKIENRSNTAPRKP